jgi:23S rRNA pseudouridine1911/1915/1917 synthase
MGTAVKVVEQLQVFHFDLAQPQRLDVFLTTRLPEYSRTHLQGLIKGGLVRINEEVILKAGRELEPSDLVEVRIPAPVPSRLKAEVIPLEILFENEDLLVVDKPAGMVVHPSPGHDSGTLVHAVLGHLPGMEGIGGEMRPGIVHRLDKETSGLIVIAKNEHSYHVLQDQFKDRRVEKVYLALVDGRPPSPAGRIEAPIGRNTTHRKLMAVVPLARGRSAVSEYRSLETFPSHTLLEVHPLTGRTHQIRVHLAFLGCPVVGDRVYGRAHPTLDLQRHFLHASRLRILLPGEIEPRLFEAALPAELQAALDQLRQNQEA